MLALVALTLADAQPARADNPGVDESAGGGTSGGGIYGGVHLGAPGSGGSGGGTSSCTWTPGTLGPLHIPIAAPGQPPLSIQNQDGSSLALYQYQCPGQALEWVWVLQATASQLATIAADAVRKDLPAPSAVFSPASGDDLVHLPTWFAVPAGQWKAVSLTADVPGLAATVTATPTSLSFDPGDGGGQVSCSGPGPQWRAGMSEPARAPACSYAYTNSSALAPNGRTWPVQVSIRWRISWTATNGQGGPLNGLTTSSTYQLAVGELEAVERTP